jgi:hypothetical protein
VVQKQPTLVRKETVRPLQLDRPAEQKIVLYFDTLMLAPRDMREVELIFVL